MRWHGLWHLLPYQLNFWFLDGAWHDCQSFSSASFNVNSENRSSVFLNFEGDAPRTELCSVLLGISCCCSGNG